MKKQKQIIMLKLERNRKKLKQNSMEVMVLLKKWDMLKVKLARKYLNTKQFEKSG